MKHFRWLRLFLILAGIAFVTASADEQSPLFRKFLKTQKTIRTFRADFVQKKEMEILEEPVVTKGVITVSKPDRLHWDFQEPEKRLVVSNGNKIWDYDPELETVEIYRISGNPDVARTVGIFQQLLGIDSKDISEDYRIQTEKSGENAVFTLFPLSDPLHEHIRRIRIVAGPDMRLRETSVTASDKTRTRILFSSMKENIQLDASLFSFQVPKGVDVSFPMKTASPDSKE